MSIIIFSILCSACLNAQDLSLIVTHYLNPAHENMHSDGVEVTGILLH